MTTAIKQIISLAEELRATGQYTDEQVKDIEKKLCCLPPMLRSWQGSWGSQFFRVKDNLRKELSLEEKGDGHAIRLKVEAITPGRPTWVHEKTIDEILACPSGDILWKTVIGTIDRDYTEYYNQHFKH